MKKSIKITYILIFVLILLGIIYLKYSFNNSTINDNISNTTPINIVKKEIKTISDFNSSISGDIDSLKIDFGNLTSVSNLENLSNSMKTEDFIKTQEIVDIILTDMNNKNVSNNNLKIEALKYIKVGAILNEGNYFYKEKEKSTEAINIIQNDILKNGNNKGTYYSNYFLGYSKEIVKDYSGSLNYYNKALNIISNINDKKYKKSIVLNQIGHVYDLMGNSENANKYYILSEKLGFNSYLNLLNRGRYEYRKNNMIEAEKYFNKILKLNINSFIKSEVYSDLSNIYLLKKDGINKAIEYAKLGIKINNLYPNNYNSLGIAYIQKGGKDMNKSIFYLDQAIKIYPNNSNAYRWKAIYYYIKDDYNKSIINFKKQLELSSKDINLMKDEKENNKKSALYDLSKTYALNNNIEKSNYYLNLLLDGKDKYFYVSFLAELGANNGPFDKIKTDNKFVLNLNKIIKLYNN